MALGLNGLLATWSAGMAENDETEKIARRASSVALVRLIFYGLALVLATLTDWLSFFAAAGGVLVPGFTLRFKEALKNR
ncbi:MAG: hypothetical protein ACLFN7_04415 [Candidatus Acetothermia bacterium]